MRNVSLELRCDCIHTAIVDTDPNVSVRFSDWHQWGARNTGRGLENVEIEKVLDFMLNFRLNVLSYPTSWLRNYWSTNRNGNVY